MEFSFWVRMEGVSKVFPTSIVAWAREPRRRTNWINTHAEGKSACAMLTQPPFIKRSGDYRRSAPALVDCENATVYMQTYCLLDMFLAAVYWFSFWGQKTGCLIHLRALNGSSFFAALCQIILKVFLIFKSIHVFSKNLSIGECI